MKEMQTKSRTYRSYDIHQIKKDKNVLIIQSSARVWGIGIPIHCLWASYFYRNGNNLEISVKIKSVPIFLCSYLLTQKIPFLGLCHRYTPTCAKETTRESLEPAPGLWVSGTPATSDCWVEGPRLWVIQSTQDILATDRLSTVPLHKLVLHKSGLLKEQWASQLPWIWSGDQTLSL